MKEHLVGVVVAAICALFITKPSPVIAVSTGAATITGSRDEWEDLMSSIISEREARIEEKLREIEQGMKQEMMKQAQEMARERVSKMTPKPEATGSNTDG